MNNRPLSLALAGLGIAGTLVALQSPVAAAPGDPKKKDLAETGCKDITYGTSQYVRDRTVDNSAFQAPDGSYPDELQGDAGTATLKLVLGEAQTPGGVASCPGVNYTLTAYGVDKKPLSTVTLAGDGATGTRANPFVLSTRVSYPNDCLMIAATTSISGVVIDSAPDVLPDDFAQICDGQTPGLTYK